MCMACKQSWLVVAFYFWSFIDNVGAAAAALLGAAFLAGDGFSLLLVLDIGIIGAAAAALLGAAFLASAACCIATCCSTAATCK